MSISRLAVATALMSCAITPAHAEEATDSEGETIHVIMLTGDRRSPGG